MSFVRNLVDELNRARTNPFAYADKVEKYKGYFKEGNILKIPHTNVGIRTQEGPAAFDECIKFLRNEKLLSGEPLVPSKGLTRIAQDMLVIIQEDATKIASMDMKSMVAKYGTFTGAFNRVMECGGCTPEQVVINLLVSDGDKTRGQRNAILNNNQKRVGVATGEHNVYKQASIITLAETFNNTVDADDTESYGGQSYGAYEVNKQPQPKQRPQFKPESEPPRAQQNNSELPMLKQKIVENKGGSSSNNYESDPNIERVDRSERIVVEKGKRKKKITLTKHYKDGHEEKEILFENL